MCGRYAVAGPVSLSSAATDALDQLGLDLASAIDTREPQYNVSPTQRAPVVAAGADRVEVKGLRWGLVPGWAKDVKIGSHAINARAESVARKPMFRAAFRRRRCLVPASGYFEWRQEGDHKQPYYIHGPGGELLLFAGLWEAWRPGEDAEWVKTYTIITGAPGRVSGDIHDRQPVILPPDTWADWLGEGADVASDILSNAPEAELAYYPVSRAVGSPRNKGPELLEPITL